MFTWETESSIFSKCPLFFIVNIHLLSLVLYVGYGVFVSEDVFLFCFCTTSSTLVSGFFTEDCIHKYNIRGILENNSVSLFC